jgi:predicted RNase H-like nuclease (RuvC/YqgF family)
MPDQRDDRAVNELITVVREHVAAVKDQDRDIQTLTRTTDRLELVTTALRTELDKIARIFEGETSPTARIIKIEQQIEGMKTASEARDKRIEFHWRIMWGIAVAVAVEIIHAVATHYGFGK